MQCNESHFDMVYLHTTLFLTFDLQLQDRKFPFTMLPFLLLKIDREL